MTVHRKESIIALSGLLVSINIEPHFDPLLKLIYLYCTILYTLEHYCTKPHTLRRHMAPSLAIVTITLLASHGAAEEPWWSG